MSRSGLRSDWGFWRKRKCCVCVTYESLQLSPRGKGKTSFRNLKMKHESEGETLRARTVIKLPQWIRRRGDEIEDKYEEKGKMETAAPPILAFRSRLRLLSNESSFLPKIVKGDNFTPRYHVSSERKRICLFSRGCQCVCVCVSTLLMLRRMRKD